MEGKRNPFHPQTVLRGSGFAIGRLNLRTLQTKMGGFALSLLFTLALCLTSLPAIANISTTSPQSLQTQSLDLTPEQLFQQGEGFYQRGRFADAIALLEQAAAAYQKQGNVLKQAAVLSNVSLSFQQLGRWQEAQTAIDASLKLLAGGGGEQNDLLAQALDIQGALQLATGQPEKALETWQQATDRYTQRHNLSGIVRSQINQARALQVSGFYRRALELLTAVSQRLQSQPDSRLKAAALRSLGDALQLTGKLEQSRAVLQASLDIAQRLQDPEAISAAQFSLGNTARAQQDQLAAITFYQQAAVSAPTLLAAIQAQINQLSLLATSEHPTDAIALMDRIQAQLVKLPPSRDSLYAQINVAQTAIMLSAWNGNTPATATSMRQSIASLLVQTAQQAKMLQDKPAEAYALGTLGSLYEQSQQWADAQQLTQQAILLAEAINASEIAYRWQWQLGRLLNAQGNLVEAVTAYNAAIAHLKLLRSDLVAINRDVQFNFRDSVEPLYRQMIALLFQLQASNPSEQTLNRAREVVESLQLAELDNFFHEACINAQSIALDQVVDQENPTTAIIYPIVLEQQSQVIVKIPKQPLRNYPIATSRSAIEQTLKQLRRKLVAPDAESDAQKVGQQVYRWLIQPIEPDLQQAGVDTLVFVLDGAFRNVPMAALHDGKQYLIEKYAVVLNSGLQLLKTKELTQKATLDVIAAGLSDPPSAFRDRYSSLPEIKTELNLIQQSGIKTQILFNQAFSRAALAKAIQSLPFNIVHLATHGKFSSQANNTYVLAADGPIYVDTFDTVLRDREQTRPEPIDLLVLSACETAEGDNRATLGLAGMAIRAGARSTLASLWQVNDRSTALLMGAFYRELAKPAVTKAEALRRAQRSLMASPENPEYARPQYWAAYVLVGNWL